MAQIVNRVFNRDFNELFAQQARFAALFVLPFGQVLRSVFNFFLHHVQVVDKRLFLVFRQFVKGFRTEYLAVFDRRDDQSDRHMQQRNAFAFGLFLQQADVFLLFLLIFFADNAQGRLIFVAVQHGRNGRRKFFDKFVNVLGKFGSVAGGKGYGNRLVRFFKIVNVNPVLRGWTLFGLFDQNTFDQAGLAGSLGAETEQVVPFGLDVDAEFHGAQGAILPQCRKPLFQLCGCCKLELVRVAFFV